MYFFFEQGLRTSLHSDPNHSLLLHVHGKKRVILMPPEETDDQHVLPKVREMRHTSGTIAQLYIKVRKHSIFCKEKKHLFFSEGNSRVLLILRKLEKYLV